MSDILETIAERTREDLVARKARLPEAELERMAVEQVAARPRVSLHDALTRPGVNIIAELKRASPSKGTIRADLDLADVASAYEANGAAAISVLTEEHWFKGSLDVLRAVRKRVSLPLLRKDFVIDRYQILEAAEAGADAVLLIAALLPDDALFADFLSVTHAFGMEALCEAHTQEEMERLVKLGAKNIGVNCRDLRTFQVFPERSEEILSKVQIVCAKVAESGIRTRADLEYYPSADAFLIGETLMRADDPGMALHELIGEKPMPVRVKICGLTNEADARFAAEAGADYLGFVFAPSSPRRIEPEALAAFAGRLPKDVKKVGVFVDASAEEIESVRKLCGLDVVQLHGHETRELAERLSRGGEVWKALATTGPDALRDADAFVGFTLLADNERGGLRRRCDHAIAREMASSSRLFLAGGLDAGNVAKAIRAVRPYGVDAASGVESSPGVKDHEKVLAFINAVKRSQKL